MEKINNQIAGGWPRNSGRNPSLLRRCVKASLRLEGRVNVKCLPLRLPPIDSSSSSSSSSFPPLSVRAAAETVVSWWVLMALRPAAIHAGHYMHCCHPCDERLPPSLTASHGAMGGEEERRGCWEKDSEEIAPVFTWKQQRRYRKALVLYFMWMVVSLSSYPFVSRHCCLFVARDERDGGEEEQTSSGANRRTARTFNWHWLEHCTEHCCRIITLTGLT